MKKIVKDIASFIIVLSISINSAVYSYGFGGVDETVALVATAVKSEDLDPAGSVLDNFNDNGIFNIWGGETGTFTDAAKDGSCSKTNNLSEQYEGNFCLKLTYDVSETDSFAGYYSRLMSYDLSMYTALTFYVKGAVGGEFFKIQLKNTGTTSYWYDANGDTDEQTHYYRNVASVYITDYLDGGVTTGWQKVSIPLRNFSNLDGFSEMKELVIAFENSQAETNGSPVAGSIYIDKIEMISNTVNSLRILR